MRPKPSSARPAKPATRPAKANSRPSSRRKSSGRSFADVVGAETYQVWVRMLSALVPGGRTHRLAPLVAAMLQYATERAEEARDDDAGEGALTASLLETGEVSDPAEVKDLIHDAVVRLFKDAGVPFERTSSRGHSYGIADDAYAEYRHWFDMPWE